MSEVYPLLDGWVGYGDGASVLLETGTAIDSEHPAVKERPELFTKPPADKPPADKPKPGARPKSSNG